MIMAATCIPQKRIESQNAITINVRENENCQLTQSITVQNVMWQRIQHRNKHHWSPLKSLQPHSHFVPHLYMGITSRSSQKTQQLSACLDLSLPLSSPLRFPVLMPWSPIPFGIYLFIYLFIQAVLGLRFCARPFSSCGKWGPLFMVRGPLTVAASSVAEHRLQMRRLSSCGSRAQLLHGMWDLPRPGLEPTSPALAGRFSTTAPPGKPPFGIYYCCYHSYYLNFVVVVEKMFPVHVKIQTVKKEQKAKNKILFLPHLYTLCSRQQSLEFFIYLSRNFLCRYYI